MVTKITKKYTLPVAMLSFSIGGLLLILFPSNLIMLMAGAVFCGFSQGIFIPQAMVDVAGAVKPVATAMASACFTCNVFRSGNIANGSEYHLEAGIRRSFHYECIHHFRDWNDSSCSYHNYYEKKKGKYIK